MDNRVREICKEKGVTLKGLAQRIGVSDAALRKALNGNPTIGTLERIAAALGVEVADLLGSKAEVRAVCPHCGKSISLRIGK